mgnify:FL=1
MDHLTVLDAGFLHAEDSDPNISLAIGGISVLEGPPPDFDVLVDTLTERLAQVPRLRQVLHTHRLDMGAPVLEDRPELDLRHQIKHAAVPAPGDDADLFRLAASIVERRLDRRHPLWECWVIEGLRDDRWALLMKVHHCLADGVSTARMLTDLSDNGSGATTFEIGATHERRVDPAPRITLNPLVWGRAAWNLSAAAVGTGAQAVKGTVEVLSGLLSPGGNTSLLGPVSTMRRYHAARASLADIHDICQAFDVTLNDVALAAITEGFRAVLLGRGEKPGRDSLRTLVPVSVRAHANPATSPLAEPGKSNVAGPLTHGKSPLAEPGNQVSLMLPLLPVDRANPLDQLRIVHQRMTRAKSSGQKQAGSSAIGAADLIPFPLTAWTVRTLARVPQRGVVTVATNVPGPRDQLKVLGRNVIQMYPIPPIALQLRIGIAMLSYGDEFTFGIVADYDSAPDIHVLTEGIERAITRLTELARQPRRAAGLSRRARR